MEEVISLIKLANLRNDQGKLKETLELLTLARLCLHSTLESEQLFAKEREKRTLAQREIIQAHLFPTKSEQQLAINHNHRGGIHKTTRTTTTVTPIKREQAHSNR